MQASIIIPTYNEAELLPRLLEDIRAQRAITYEVIVADAQSTDDTRELARAAGARVVEGGMPAKGRNAGAAVAQGDFLVFLDADVRVPKTFLRNALSEMRARELASATCPIRPISKLTTDKILHNFANLFIRVNQRTDPHAPGYCILMRRNVFEAIGGFDESLKVAEDHDVVTRAAKQGPFRILSSTFVRVNVRRFEKEGRLWYALKTIKVALYRATVGEISEDDSVVEYEFGDFSEDEVRGRRKMLRQLEKRLIQLDRETTRLNERVLHGNEERPGAVEQLQRTGEALRRAWEELFESSAERDGE